MGKGVGCVEAVCVSPPLTLCLDVDIHRYTYIAGATIRNWLYNYCRYIYLCPFDIFTI